MGCDVDPAEGRGLSGPSVTQLFLFITSGNVWFRPTSVTEQVRQENIWSRKTSGAGRTASSIWSHGFRFCGSGDGPGHTQTSSCGTRMKGPPLHLISN